MKHLIILTSILMLCSSMTAQTAAKDCSKFREGTFKMVDTRTGVNYQIERTATRQTEFDLNAGSYITFSISWTTDCDYELKYIDGNSETAHFFKSKQLVFKILETYADGYKFEGHIKGQKNFKTFYMRMMPSKRSLQVTP